MTNVRKQLVVSIHEDGRPEVIGGPYPPIDAKDIRDSFRKHIQRGNHGSWNIPRETAKLVAITSERLYDIVKIYYGSDEDE